MKVDGEVAGRCVVDLLTCGNNDGDAGSVKAVDLCLRAPADDEEQLEPRVRGEEGSETGHAR